MVWNARSYVNLSFATDVSTNTTSFHVVEPPHAATGAAEDVAVAAAAAAPAADDDVGGGGVSSVHKQALLPLHLLLAIGAAVKSGDMNEDSAQYKAMTAPEQTRLKTQVRTPRASRLAPHTSHLIYHLKSRTSHLTQQKRAKASPLRKLLDEAHMIEWWERC